jgi:hypothetical protein
MDNEIKELNSIIKLCEDLADLQFRLDVQSLGKAGQAIFQKCGCLINQGSPYSFMDAQSDEYSISISLSKKSFMETNDWDWAKIDIVKSDNTKKVLAYKIFISDAIWANVDDNQAHITPSVHMSDIDIFKSLNNQLEHTYKLVKELVGLDLTKECPIEHILAEHDVYFNLATEIKEKSPLYFQWILLACEKDTILLKNLKEFILKDHKDQDLSINIKLSMTDKIDKLLLKNDLEENLDDKKKTKLKKI